MGSNTSKNEMDKGYKKLSNNYDAVIKELKDVTNGQIHAQKTVSVQIDMLIDTSEGENNQKQKRAKTDDSNNIDIKMGASEINLWESKTRF